MKTDIHYTCGGIELVFRGYESRRKLTYIGAQRILTRILAERYPNGRGGTRFAGVVTRLEAY